MQTLQRYIAMAANRTDLVLAVLLVSVIFMMILPLPTALIDTLIAINMCISAILLMVAMYLPSPLAFSSFPTVLLITTLFRLALSISTTRLILLQADAGHIVETFGNFVVGGNLIVGLVVFLIITIVQFIVITKGSERVAEVSARFSLDAMPGKQMSIDGDMRAGVIDMDEARRRRSIVEKESQLYGSMDGAMKFVKGDAIASLIVVAVNLLGGIIIGTMQRGMSAGDAMHLYSVLTIGDGLIAQIPALFISITAGIIVTRVSNDGEGPSNVGKDIGTQILAQPRALMIGAVIMFGFALIPGMPTVIFVILAAVVGGLAFILLRPAKTEARSKLGDPALNNLPGMAAAGQKTGGGNEEFSSTVPLIIDIAANLEQVAFKADVLNEDLAKIRRALYFELGVPFPGIQLRFNDTLPDNNYTIMLNEIPVAQGILKPGYLLVRESEENLQALGVAFETGARFLPSSPTIWVAEDLKDTLNNVGISSLEMTQILIHHLAYVLKKYAQDFLGIQETRFLLGIMEPRYPDLVKEVQRVLPIQKIAEILQRLVSEDVSVRNLRTILEALVDWGQKEKDSVLLTEYIRTALKRHISFKYSGTQGILPAYLLAPDVEETIRNAVRQTSGGSYLALDPAVSKRLIDVVKLVVGDPSAATQRPVLVTAMDIRRYVRKLIEQDLYELAVLSFQELAMDVNIQPLGRIEL
jgi:type III secretion protein V